MVAVERIGPCHWDCSRDTAVIPLEIGGKLRRCFVTMEAFFHRFQRLVRDQKQADELLNEHWPRLKADMEQEIERRPELLGGNLQINH